MQILFVTVRKPPQGSWEAISPLNSYPALLVDEPNLFKRVAGLNPQQVFEEVTEFAPAFLVYQGQADVTAAWKNWGEAAFPRLLAYATDEIDPFTVLETLNQKLWGLRRQRLKPSGRSPEPASVDWSMLFQSLDNAKRSAALKYTEQLLTTYQLEPLGEQVNTEAMERLLYCISLLEQTLSNSSLPTTGLNVLDVGTHLWSYAPGLAAYFRQRSSEIHLSGLEIDPWYLQTQGLLRSEWAQHYAHLAQAQWYEGDLETHPLPPQDVICFFLPLVLTQNTIIWRIPTQYHNPVHMFKRAHWQLKPGGHLLIYNGVEKEYQATLEALQNAGLTPTVTGPYTCPLRQQPQGYLTHLVKRTRLGN